MNEKTFGQLLKEASIAAKIKEGSSFDAKFYAQYEELVSKILDECTNVANKGYTSTSIVPDWHEITNSDCFSVYKRRSINEYAIDVLRKDPRLEGVAIKESETMDERFCFAFQW